MTVSKDFVTFYSPGTFFAEDTTKPIDQWNPAAALAMAEGITERYNAKPFGFRFTTRTREESDLDSRVTATSPMYYFGVKVETLAEVMAREPESILAANMRGNGWSHIVTATGGYKASQPLLDGDIVLDENGAPVPL